MFFPFYSGVLPYAMHFKTPLQVIKMSTNQSFSSFFPRLNGTLVAQKKTLSEIKIY
jgi:hypothetical protein